MKKYRIGIVGATGAVGQEYSYLKKKFPVAEARLLASARSAGREFKLGSLEVVKETTFDSFMDWTWQFLVRVQNTLEFEAASRQIIVVIDNSSAFRMDKMYLWLFQK